MITYCNGCCTNSQFLKAFEPQASAEAGRHGHHTAGHASGGSQPTPTGGGCLHGCFEANSCGIWNLDTLPLKRAEDSGVLVYEELPLMALDSAVRKT